MELRLREATIEDLQLVFEWANDDDVRHNSFNQEKIPFENHVKWFERRIELMNTTKESYIFILLADEKAAGQVRIDSENAEAEISYLIAKDYRGNGLAKKMLLLLEEEKILEILKIKKLTAKVKEENLASAKVFKALNYELVKSENNILSFEKSL